MTSTPSGWYPDHNDPNLVRYWDGAAWTEHTQPKQESALPTQVQPGEVSSRESAKVAKRAAKEADRQRSAYLASPIGLAEAAAQRGDRFFQVEIPHSSLSGYSSDFALAPHWDTTRVKRSNAAPDLLGKIEQVGWRLEHATWLFVQTGASSRDKIMSSGERTTVSGRVVGIYLFRATPSGA